MSPLIYRACRRGDSYVRPDFAEHTYYRYSGAEFHDETFETNGSNQPRSVSPLRLLMREMRTRSALASQGRGNPCAASSFMAAKHRYFKASVNSPHQRSSSLARG